MLPPAMYLKMVRPIFTRSPLRSDVSSRTASSLTNVPLVEPRSLMSTPRFVFVMQAWLRLMDSWSTWISAFEERPMRTSSLLRSYLRPNSMP